MFVFLLVLPGQVRADEGVRPLRVHVVHGLWSREYRLEEALAAYGGAVISESWDVMGEGFGWPGSPSQGKGGVNWRPTPAVLADTDLVIIVNVNVHNLGRSQALLADWVRDGGSVLFLGGRWALGKSLSDSPLADVAPATFAGKGQLAQTDLFHETAGLAMDYTTPGAADGLGHVYWYHRMTVRDGATVTITAGDKPIYAWQTVGRGRAGVFAGTVMGEATAETEPFWESATWPNVLAGMIRELTDGEQAAPKTDLQPLRDALERLADPLDPPTDADRKTAWNRFSAAVNQADDAAALSELTVLAAQLPGDLPEAVAMSLGTKLARRRATVKLATVTTLLESGQMHKTVVGLFAASGAEASIVARLTPFLAKPEPAAAKAAAELDFGGGDGLPDAGLRDAVSRERGAYLIRYAALIALSRLADPAARPAIAKLQDSLEGVEVGANRSLDMLSDEQRLWQLCLLARLSCGEHDLAPTLAAVLLETRFVISRARSEGNKPDERLEKVHAQLPENMAWETTLYHELTRLPTPAAQALAPALAGLSDRRVGPLALALCASHPDPAVRAPLATSPHAPLRRLAGK